MRVCSRAISAFISSISPAVLKGTRLLARAASVACSTSLTCFSLTSTADSILAIFRLSERISARRRPSAALAGAARRAPPSSSSLRALLCSPSALASRFLNPSKDFTLRLSWALNSPNSRSEPWTSTPCVCWLSMSSSYSLRPAWACSCNASLAAIFSFSLLILKMRSSGKPIGSVGEIGAGRSAGRSKRTRRRPGVVGAGCSAGRSKRTRRRSGVVGAGCSAGCSAGRSKRCSGVVGAGRAAGGLKRTRRRPGVVEVCRPVSLMNGGSARYRSESTDRILSAASSCSGRAATALAASARDIPGYALISISTSARVGGTLTKLSSTVVPASLILRASTW